MAQPLDSELLRTFLVIAEYGNFTHAADKVGRTQSAVSMQVQKLEAILETKLFARGPRGVVMTKDGERLVPHAKKVVMLSDETAAVMRATKLEGQVRIGIPEEYAQTILPRAIAAFSGKYPSAEVTTFCGYTRQQLAALEKDELDIAVVFDVTGQMEGEILAIDPTVWATSIAHNQHVIKPVPIAIYWDSRWCREYPLQALKQHAISYRIAYSCDTAGPLAAAVIAGIAIAPLATSAIPSGCRKLTVEEGFPPIDTCRVVLRHNPRTANAATLAIAETVKEAFRPLNVKAS